MRDMEERLRQVEINQARQEVVVEQLQQVVLENTQAIRDLTAVLNKGKGAAWVMAGVYTLFGGALALIIAWLKG